MDGNTAAAYVSYAFTEVAAIYPITPSSTMAEQIDNWSAQGRKNIFGSTVLVKEMQSEGGAAAALHGALQSGALTSTYTASQGLLLMIPNMYKIAGELLPGVFHVSARSLASNALSIFGDHQDVMSTRQTGFALLASSGVQQCMDLGAVAHLAAIRARLPFLHFFDGFRTSHEIQKIEVLEYEELKKLVDFGAVEAFRQNALNPDHPVLRGTTQNPDVFFQTREAVNRFYDALPDIVQESMDQINALTGRNYHLFDYHGCPDAEEVIVAMGSACDTIRQVIDHLNRQGDKLGVLEVHLYRPFANERFLAAIPDTVRRIVVLDRTKEPGADGEPLYLDVRNAFYGREHMPLIIGGRYGLGSKDFTPEDVMAIIENLRAEHPKTGFTVSIEDDVTFTSLPKYTQSFDPTPMGTTACQFWGLGSDGTVSANKSAVKIIGDHTPLHAQAYFAYDSKKSGGLTVSHLRFGKEPICAPYLVKKADFIACHNQAYVHQYDLLESMKEGGVFLLNCIWSEDELEQELPASLKRGLAQKNVKFYTINAVKIAKEIGLGGRINMIMQAAFFKLANILPLEEAKQYLKGFVEKNYGRQGQNVVDMNCAAIDAGAESIVRVTIPDLWRSAADEPAAYPEDMPEFIRDIMIPMNRQKGDTLPVSAFRGREDGTYPTGVTAWEKRGIAIEIPVWDAEKCIQCNQCSFACPHAVLRPMLLTAEEAAAAPKGHQTAKATGYPEKRYRLALSPLDCTGCGVCVHACPAKQKALIMTPLASVREQLCQDWAYDSRLPVKKEYLTGKLNVKTCQFCQPLQEFSGACAGCGETPYAKLVTQLFGDRMMISNAAGCSTVWGGSAPSVSYTKDARGHGPCWGFSLFEDNAEYGFGMFLGVKAIRDKLTEQARLALQKDLPQELYTALDEWLRQMDEGSGTRERADRLTAALKKFMGADELLQAIYERRDYFTKRSHWIFGGDGWAYDIGYGGLDHVLASGDDVNVLVFDTEVYSNTGGQSSKSTPTAAIAQFAASGKKTCKKDLGMMAMSYGYVYVAQIAMGADRAQTLRAIQEAEAYHGPSLIIAYSPCVNHGIKGGMSQTQLQQKRAVEAGYWSLYRYDPRKKQEGQNPFVLDSKEPTADFKSFLLSEVRYASLKKQYPQQAEELYAKAAADARERLDKYRAMAQQ